MPEPGIPLPRQLGPVVTCERCGRPCKVNQDRNPDALLLRHADQGVCASCAMTAFLKTMEPLATVIREKGTSILAMPAAQAQVAAVLAAGNSDASPVEIDWPAVIDNWDLPS